MFGSAESQVPKLISREIIFAEFNFQRVWSQSTNVTDGRTADGQLIMAIPRYATLRAVKTNTNITRGVQQQRKPREAAVKYYPYSRPTFITALSVA